MFKENPSRCKGDMELTPNSRLTLIFNCDLDLVRKAAMGSAHCSTEVKI